MNSPITEFPVVVYGKLEKYNDVLSKARCRIFYKYGNRNGTFITDSFAEQLLKSLPYTPVKGIYDETNEDFSDHGAERTEGRVYGIVPENPNASYEKFLDEDGVEREYACCDVLLFTALYPEANNIINKPQSMELYEPSLKFHQAVINNQKYFVFDNGCFLGLQILGDYVEPCFEGASFYTLRDSIENVITKIKEYSKGGQLTMLDIFKLCDDEKRQAIFNLLNPNFNEAGNWDCEYDVIAVYDNYALCIQLADRQYVRVAYTKNDETNTVELGDKTNVFIVDVTEKEKEILDTLCTLNGGTYELVNENLANAENNANTCVELNTKIEECNLTISTLQTEAEKQTEALNELQTNLDNANIQLNSLNEENKQLKEYKHNVELLQKENIFTEYADKLNDDVIKLYRDKIDEYSVIDLDKELAYELKKANITSFTSTKEEDGMVPKFNDVDGLSAILSRYKK